MQDNYRRETNLDLLPIACAEDGRRSQRISIRRVISIISCDPGDGFSELETTENISSDGLFFITRRKCYFRGLNLAFTFPGPEPLAKARRYAGEVVRVIALSGGRFGVGVHTYEQIRVY